jgi:predicted Zn-ribbon and HTH transcriptional regulator
MAHPKCKKCGQEFLRDHKNYVLCLDCRMEREGKPLQQLGREDLVQHFAQDIGTRLQRIKWGHFNS